MELKNHCSRLLNDKIETTRTTTRSLGYSFIIEFEEARNIIDQLEILQAKADKPEGLVVTHEERMAIADAADRDNSHFANVLMGLLQRIPEGDKPVQSHMEALIQSARDRGHASIPVESVMDALEMDNAEKAAGEY